MILGNELLVLEQEVFIGVKKMKTSCWLSEMTNAGRVACDIVIIVVGLYVKRERVAVVHVRHEGFFFCTKSVVTQGFLSRFNSPLPISSTYILFESLAVIQQRGM